MVSQVEVALDTINIYLISDIIYLISSDSLKDNRFKFSDQKILRIMILKEIKRLSLRGIVKELHSNYQSTYILLDSAHDSEEIYNTIFEKTSAIPIIDINPRRGSSKPSKKDDLNRWIMKNLRIKYALLYKDRWEIERVNSNLKSTYFFSLEDVNYVPHRHYEQAVGLKLLVHNLVAFANISV